jgi:hypothetical protein
MSVELRELQLHSLEDIRFQCIIKSFADQAQGKEGVLVASAHAHIPKQDKAEDFGGKRIHCGEGRPKLGRSDRKGRRRFQRDREGLSRCRCRCR